MSDDFFTRLERQLEAAELRELKRAPALRRLVNPRRLLSVPLAAAAAAGVVVVILAVLGAIDNNDADQRPQPVGTVPAPSMEVVADATGVERGIHFGLDGRVLTVQLLPPVRNQTFETVSGAEISATCGTNVTTSPGDPRSETTLFRRWPAGQTTLSYHFPRDVSSWCRLDRQPVGIVAFVRFPGASPGAKGPIAEIGNNWARLFASSAQACNAYTRGTACEGVTCRGCEPSKKAWQWAEAHLTATVQKTAVSGDRAAAKLSNGNVLQLRRSASGEWLIDGFGEFGLPAELRRKL